MSVFDVDVPAAKWSLIEWRNYQNDKPAENDRCLIIVGKDVVAARFTHGAFFANNWTRAEGIVLWSPWPKAPVS